MCRTFLVGLACVSIGCGGERSRPPDAAPAIKIGVVPRGTTHQYWQAVHAGASRAARDLGVELMWSTAFRDGNIQAQIDEIRRMQRAGVHGIAFAPISPDVIDAVAGDLNKANVRIVTFDTPPPENTGLPFIGSDNRAAGKLAGEHLATILPGGGRVIALRTSRDATSTEARVDGFLEAAKAFPGIEILSADRYAGSLLEGAFLLSHELLSSMEAAEGKVHAIFCPNETTTIGMLRALENEDLDRKIHLIGFDRSPWLVNVLRAGKLSALVVQDPVSMGDRSVRALVAAIRDRVALAPRTTTTFRVVSAKNVDAPELRTLLQPDLVIAR